MADAVVNLAPAEPHLLDTSAVVHLIRQRVTAGVEAFIPFATLGELATGTFRVDDRQREAARVRAAIGPARPLFATEQTTVHFERINAHLQRTGKLAAEVGHTSPAVVFQHYRELVEPEDAARY